MAASQALTQFVEDGIEPDHTSAESDGGADFMYGEAVKDTTANVDRRGALSLVEILPKPTGLWCVDSLHEDCSASKCCQDMGFQCFQKNSSWAACLKTCDANTSWTCKALGSKTRCASATENCQSFGCCAESGHQCYAKNAYWGSCMKTCSPEKMQARDSHKEPWSCDPIGPVNTLDYTVDYTVGTHGLVEVEPWVKNCSHIGDNCKSTKCCAWSGYKCYEKDATWSSCLKTCFPNKWNGGKSEKPLFQPGKPVNNPPPHANATFSIAPTGPWTCKRLSVPKKPGMLIGTSLFCFTVALTENGNGKKLYELDIIKKAQEKYTHVFACNRWMVFSDKETQLNPGKTIKVDFPHTVRRPNTKNWVNTPLFFKVWTIIRKDAAWNSFPWIVKSDPSAVFIPQRLRELVKYQRATENGVFLENCKTTRMSFHGSLEVVSNKAFLTFLDHLEDCKRLLPYQNAAYAHFRYYGEDKFMAWCMHAFGVDKAPSRQEVQMVPDNQLIRGLHLTVSCPAHRGTTEGKVKKWHPNCTRSKTAGLHAFRTVAKWMKCFEQTTA